MTKTIITFADYYRDAPLVLSSDSPKFVILFNADDDVIRIQENWDYKVHYADFALEVSVQIDHVHDCVDWTMMTHSDSPARMFRAHPQGLTVWDELPNDHDEYMTQGEVFHFTFPPYCTRKEIGIMLHTPKKDISEEEPSATEPLKPNLLEELPPELHRAILDELPIYEVLHILPYVSTRMFQIAKSGSNWKQLNFELFHPTLRNLLQVTDKCHQACSKLTVKDTNNDQMNPAWSNQQEFYNRLFWKTRWSCLTHLHIEGQFDSFDANLIKFGCKKGNFPSLKMLKIFLKEGISWDHLFGCSMEHLKQLEVSIGSTFKYTTGRQFWNQFTGLETLGVVVLHASAWQDELFPRLEGKVGPTMANILPNLKTLKMGIISHQLTQEVLTRELQCFSGMNIQRLCLYKLSLDRVDSDEPVVIPGNWLFTNFSLVKSMCIQGNLQVDWMSVPKASLKKLIHLRTPLHQPTDEIPFEAMENLEAVCLHLRKLDNPVGDQKSYEACSSLKILRKLPKLTTVKMAGASVLTPLLPEKGSTWNIHSLDFSRWYFPNVFLLSMDETGDNPVLQLAEYFPNLQRLALPMVSLESEGAEFVSQTLKSFKSILQLEIPRFDFSELAEFKKNFPDQSFEVVIPFFDEDDEEEELEDDDLSGRGIFRANGSNRAGKECFVFDDELFCFGDFVLDYIYTNRI